MPNWKQQMFDEAFPDTSQNISDELIRLNKDLQNAFNSGNKSLVVKSLNEFQKYQDREKQKKYELEKEEFKKAIQKTANKFPCLCCGGKLIATGNGEGGWAGWVECKKCPHRCLRSQKISDEEEVQKFIQGRISKFKELCSKVLKIAGIDHSSDLAEISGLSTNIIVFDRSPYGGGGYNRTNLAIHFGIEKQRNKDARLLHYTHEDHRENWNSLDDVVVEVRRICMAIGIRNLLKV